MKNLKQKSINLALLLMLQLVISMPYTYAVTISGVEAIPLSDTSSKISWLTDADGNSTAYFGKDNLESEKSSKSFEKEHSIIIEGLVKSQEYKYSVKSCDTAEACASSAELKFIAGKDDLAPFINVSIPGYAKEKSININGNTEEFSTVSLYVNDLGNPLKTLTGNQVANGRFSFSDVRLEQKNTIRILAVDRAGNQNEKLFEVEIDAEPPAVKLEPIPPLTKNVTLLIKGNSNEKAVMKVFMAKESSEIFMSKVTGLKISKEGQNSIEIVWDESKDKGFSHYVVYRDNVQITTTKPASFNVFVDALVDSGKKYSYRVSAVSTDGNEGPKSDEAAASTKTGGKILGLAYPKIEIVPSDKEAVLIKNVSGNFEETIKLGKGDGRYKVNILFEDKALNAVSFDRKTELDTKKPQVTIQFPKNGANVYENTIGDIDVIGKTEPNARVHLYVDRTPFSSYDISLGVNVLPSGVSGPSSEDPENILSAELKTAEDRLENISKAELDVLCRNNSKSRCIHAADLSTTADFEGNFKFEDIDLSGFSKGGFNFQSAARIKQVKPTDIREVNLNQEAKESRTTSIVAIAVDKADQVGVGVSRIKIGNCWSGNQSWDIIPLLPLQGPSMLSAERLREDTETVYFAFNFSYIGRGQNARIKSVSLTKACSAAELSDERFKMGCELLPGGGIAVPQNPPENTITYSEINLNRYKNMDKFLEDDWKAFFKAIGNEVSFPFKVRINYVHDVYEDGQLKTGIIENQATCEEVTYIVDNTLLDPRKLPDAILYDFVDFLQESIKTINDVQEYIKKVNNYVAIGCMASFAGHFGTKVLRTWAELKDEAMLNFPNFVFTPVHTQEVNYCNDALIKIKSKNPVVRLKYFTDEELEKCFPSSAKAWATEAKLYEAQRWSCDRLFGHSTPSKWTEEAKDEDLQKKLTRPDSCASDNAEKGLAIRAVECSRIEGKYKTAGIHSFGSQTIGKKCFEIRSDPSNPNDFYVWAFADTQDPNLVANNIYTLIKYENRPKLEKLYAIKVTDDQYFTSLPQTCDQICGTGAEKTDTKVYADGKELSYNSKELKKKLDEAKKQENTPKAEDKPLELKMAGCMPKSECLDMAAKSIDSKSEAKIDFPEDYPEFKNKNYYLKNHNVEVKGYTSDCFYDPGDDAKVVSASNPNTREVCCCITGKGQSTSSLSYYHPGDTSIYTGNKIHGSKEGEAAPSQYPEMKWSYRYWKEKYQAQGKRSDNLNDPAIVLKDKYNPYRYIEGRDKPACFGQDSLLHQATDKKKEILVLNPFKQTTAALQCLYITGIDQRLELLKNLMAGMSGCLVEVRETGRADAGACKELFTQRVCDVIWQGVRFFVDGCSQDEYGISTEEREDDVASNLKLGFRGIAKSVSESQREVMEEYGNVQANVLFGYGEQSVARKICLGAFGYDWEFGKSSFIDAAYAAPYGSLVLPITKSREFITINPKTLQPKYEYRGSWIINPGCDLDNYKVELACVSRKEADKYPGINCGKGSGYLPYERIPGASTNAECDCFELPEERRKSFIQENRLKQGVMIEKDYHNVFQENYRYDHLKFTLTPSRRIDSNIRQNCFPEGHEDGVWYAPLNDKTARDLADCTVQPLSGVISCNPGIDLFGGKGIAEIISVTINGIIAENFKQIEAGGEDLRVEAKILKTGKEKCVRATLIPDRIHPVYTPVILNGTTDIPPMNFGKMNIYGDPGTSISLPNGLRADLEFNQVNTAVGIRVLIIDGTDRTRQGFIENALSPDDRIVIDGYEIDMATKATPRNIGNGNPATSITFENDDIIISKENARVRIKPEYVQFFTRNSAGANEINGEIIVRPLQQGSRTQEQKTILLELMHLKEDAEPYDSAEDCNMNDIIQKKEYKFNVITGTRISPDGTAIKPSQPSRQINIIPNAGVGKCEDYRIAATINIPEGINSAKVEIFKVSANGQKQSIRVIDSFRITGEIYEFFLQTQDLEVGKYEGELTAKVRALDIEERQRFAFEIREPREIYRGGCSERSIKSDADGK